MLMLLCVGCEIVDFILKKTEKNNGRPCHLSTEQNSMVGIQLSSLIVVMKKS